MMKGVKKKNQAENLGMKRSVKTISPLRPGECLVLNVKIRNVFNSPDFQRIAAAAMNDVFSYTYETILHPFVSRAHNAVVSAYPPLRRAVGRSHPSSTCWDKVYSEPHVWRISILVLRRGRLLILPRQAKNIFLYLLNPIDVFTPLKLHWLTFAHTHAKDSHAMDFLLIRSWPAAVVSRWQRHLETHTISMTVVAYHCQESPRIKNFDKRKQEGNNK